MGCDCGCGVEFKKDDRVVVIVQATIVEQGASTTLAPQIDAYASTQTLLVECFKKKINGAPARSKVEVMDELKEALTDLRYSNRTILQEIYRYCNQVLGCRI